MVEDTDVEWFAVTHADCGEVALLVQEPFGSPFRPVAGRVKHPGGQVLVIDQVMTCGHCHKPLRGFSARPELDPPGLLTWSDQLPLPRALGSGRADRIDGAPGDSDGFTKHA